MSPSIKPHLSQMNKRHIKGSSKEPNLILPSFFSCPPEYTIANSKTGFSPLPKGGVRGGIWSEIEKRKKGEGEVTHGFQQFSTVRTAPSGFLQFAGPLPKRISKSAENRGRAKAVSVAPKSPSCGVVFFICGKYNMFLKFCLVLVGWLVSGTWDNSTKFNRERMSERALYTKALRMIGAIGKWMAQKTAHQEQIGEDKPPILRSS